MGYVYLGLAIILELAGTNCMKLLDGFSKLNYSLATLVAYGACFYFLALALKTVKLGALTWGGLGIVLASLLSVFYFHEKLSVPAICGIALIVIGTAMCNFFGTGH